MRFIDLCTQLPFTNVIICIFSITTTKIKNQNSRWVQNILNNTKKTAQVKKSLQLYLCHFYLTLMGKGQGNGEGWGDDRGGNGSDDEVINRPVQHGQWKNDLCGNCPLGGNCE